MQTPLNVSSVSKSYGSVHAVKDVSMSLEPGEIYGLLGPNGAGKTTLISCVVGLEKADQGKIVINGFDVSTSPISAKKNLGLVGQEIVNHGFFDVEEIMAFHSGYYGLINNKERIQFLLQKLSLWPHRHKKVRQLSGGMKRRLMVAKALVHSPRLLLLDEPTAGVDIELRENLWEFVRELRSDGMTILLTTHHLEEAEMLCDRVAIIHKGEIQKVGPTRSLIHELTQRSVRLECRDQTSVEFTLQEDESLGEALKAHVKNITDIVDIRISEGTLEEAFRRVIGRPE